MRPDIDYSFVAMPSVSEDGRIDASIESHVMGFRAEKSRLSNKKVIVNK